MKILVICENYYPHKGGAETLFQNLAERLVQKGYVITILTRRLRNTPRRETIKGVHVVRIPSFHSRYIFSFSALLPALKLARTSNVIQTTTFNGAFPAWIAGKIMKRPVILTVHEVWVGKWKEVTGFSTLKSSFHSLLERMIYVLPFDRYICVSHATKKDLLRIISPHKVETIYNGLDYEFWNPALVSEEKMNAFRRKYSLNQKFSCFAWGRPGASKGFEYLLKAVPLLKQKIPNFHLLLLFGSPEQYRNKYRRLITQIKGLHFTEIITLLPPSSREEIRTILRSVDCAIIPSVTEGFGYNAVEAAAMGTPVAVSDAGSLPEVISGKYQVFHKKDYQDLAEKVEKIARRCYLQKKEQRYEWSKTIQKYLDIYHRAVGSTGRD